MQTFSSVIQYALEWVVTTHNPVDTSGLEALISEAEEKTEAGYTVSSWTSFQAALSSARELLLAPHTQADIDAQVTLLQAALDGLVELPASDGLETLLTEIRQLTGISYTPGSWGMLQSALRDAEALLAGRDYTAAEVSAMMERIRSSMEALEEVDASLIVMTPEMFDTVLERIRVQILQAFGVCIALFCACVILPYLILKLRGFIRPVS